MSLPLAKIVAMAAVAAAGVAGYHAVTGNSAGMQPGPVCITQTAHPGGSYTAPVNVAGNTQHMHLSVQQIGPPAGPAYPAGGRPLPASWVSFSGVSQVTVSPPGDARPGRYGASLVVTNYGDGGGGSGTHVALGAAAAAWLEISVDKPPPPRAFCTGQRPTYWPWVPPLPVCKAGQPPLQGRQAVCRVLPLSPPVFSAKACGWTRHQMQVYLGQLRAAGRRYAHNGRAYLPDAHCIVDGRFLNLRPYYERTGIYRFADTGQTGPVAGARPTDSP